MRKGTVTLFLATLAAASCQAPAPIRAPDPDPGHARLTRLSGRAEDPFPTADRVIFALRSGSAAWKLCSISSAGPAVELLLEADADVRSPAVSPDGRSVAFSSNRRGTWDIYTAPLADPAPGQWELVAGTDDDETGPTWAPDGKRLAWAALDRREGAWQLRVRGADGSVHGLGEGFAPSWHPSRDLIACQRQARAGGVWSAVVLDVASGRATELWPESGRGALTPGWSADGRWVLFASVVERENGTEPDGLWAVSLDGAKRARLSQGGVDEWSPREGAAGRIVYSRRDGETVDLWSFASPLR